MEIKTVSAYLEKINSIYSSDSNLKSNKHLFFRGHANKTYKLQPSVFRESNYKEKEILLDFKQYSPTYDINYDFINERLNGQSILTYELIKESTQYFLGDLIENE